MRSASEAVVSFARKSSTHVLRFSVEVSVMATDAELLAALPAGFFCGGNARRTYPGADETQGPSAQDPEVVH